MAFESALKGFWKMEEPLWDGTAGEVKDETTNNNDGTRSGSATTKKGGISNRSGNFTGTGTKDYVDFGSDSDWVFGTGDYTYSIWLRYNVISPNGASVIGSFVNPLHIPSGYPWELVIHRTSGTQVEVYNASGGGDIDINDWTNSPNTWYHFLVTRNSGTLKLYIDNVERSSIGNSQDITAGTLIIGGAGVTAGLQYYLDGNAAEAAIWKRGFTPAEVQTVFERGVKYVSNESLVLYTPLSEPLWDGTADEVKDYSGQDHHGQAKNNATTKPISSRSRSGTFDGSGDFVTVADSSSLDIVDAISISCWVNTNTNAGVQMVVIKHRITGALALYGIRLNTGKPAIHLDKIGGGGAVAEWSTALTTGIWYHVLGTYNKTNLKIYINGEEKDSTAYSDDIDVSNDPLYFGRREASDWLNGDLDEIAIWDRALSAEEARLVYIFGVEAVAANTIPQNFNYPQLSSITVNYITGEIFRNYPELNSITVDYTLIDHANTPELNSIQIEIVRGEKFLNYPELNSVSFTFTPVDERFLNTPELNSVTFSTIGGDIFNNTPELNSISFTVETGQPIPSELLKNHKWFANNQLLFPLREGSNIVF